MERAKSGDTVQVHYTGRLPDGTVFDSSDQGEPIEFKLGAGDVIPGFEDGVAGMAIGEAKTVQFGPDEGYGQRREELVLEVPRGMMPGGVELEVGQRFEYEAKDGEQVPLTVTEVGEETVTLDANHPLAGRELTFELELVGIVTE